MVQPTNQILTCMNSCNAVDKTISLNMQTRLHAAAFNQIYLLMDSSGRLSFRRRSFRGAM